MAGTLGALELLLLDEQKEDYFLVLDAIKQKRKASFYDVQNLGYDAKTAKNFLDKLYRKGYIDQKDDKVFITAYGESLIARYNDCMRMEARLCAMGRYNRLTRFVMSVSGWYCQRKAEGMGYRFF